MITVNFALQNLWNHLTKRCTRVILQRIITDGFVRIALMILKTYLSGKLIRHSDMDLLSPIVGILATSVREIMKIDMA
jgi:hypothetical protein